MSIEDTLYVLPCLQERVKFSQHWEQEQCGSTIESEKTSTNEEGEEKSYKSKKTDKNIYYKIWQNKTLTETEEEIFNSDIRYLEFPTLLEGKGKCRSISVENKWEMYGKWLSDKTREINNASGLTAMFVTHHNRMRGTGVLDREGGIVPFKSKNNCNAYANNFCLRIEISTDLDITFSIVFPGFPDKGKFDGCDVPELSGGGNKYKYCCGKFLRSIDVDKIKGGLRLGISLGKGFKGQLTKPIKIYVVRHGNSIHNKPLNIKDGSQLDSSLTYLGIYQAYLLGNYLKSTNSYSTMDDFKRNKKILLCSSFLSRTQLTGLCILKTIKGKLPEKLYTNYNILLKKAIKMLMELNNTIELFEPYCPSWYCENEIIQKKFYPPIEGEDEKFDKFKGFINGLLEENGYKRIAGNYKCELKPKETFESETDCSKGGKVKTKKKKKKLNKKTLTKKSTYK